MSQIELDGISLTVDKLQQIATGTKIRLNQQAIEKVQIARQIVESKSKLSTAVYGINTGFGALANVRIPSEDLAQLQINLVRSHSVAVGPLLSSAETRALMALRLNVLLKAYSGCRPEICELLANLINHNIHPHVPSQGSVGASGDLAPLSHIALALIGEGKVECQGKTLIAKEALTQAGLSPIKLLEKEGLALINGTQAMAAVGGLALANALKLAELADGIVALTLEAKRGILDAFDPAIHLARPHPGQILSASRILKNLANSKLATHSSSAARVQDAYSLRCAAQVHGASIDALEYAKQVLEREFNAATDNPLVLIEQERLISGGNFHGQPLALSLDFAAIAVAELANISERRLEQLINPHLSGLPAFLASNPGLESGLMGLQYVAASLVNENKILSHPASTDSIPGNINIEDHVSMGMTSAKKFRQIVENTNRVLACELLAACRAIELQGKDLASPKAQAFLQRVRKVSPEIKGDRVLSEDIEAVHQLLT